MSIQRWTYDEGDGNWRFPGHVGADDGKWVKYEEHLAVVQKLEDRVRELEACYTDDLQGAYDKGFDEGHSVGFANALSEDGDRVCWGDETGY